MDFEPKHLFGLHLHTDVLARAPGEHLCGSQDFAVAVDLRPVAKSMKIDELSSVKHNLDHLRPVSRVFYRLHLQE